MKNFMKIYALLLLVFITVTVFAGCGNKDVQQGASAGAQTSAFPLTVKDAGGTEMTIEKEPSKIVSLTLGTDEILLGDSNLPGLVDIGRVAAVTPFAIDPGVSNVVEKAKSVPNNFLTKDAEKIIALQPDLILVDSWVDPAFTKQLRDAKLTVYIFKTPSSIDAEKNTILELAHIVGADARGRALVDWMDVKLKAIEDKLKGLKDGDKLLMMDYSEMGSTSGKGTNTDDILTRAGVVNAAAKAGLDGWPQVNKENIVQWNPDIILLPSWYYDQKLSLDGMKAMLKGDKSLAGVNAIKNDKLITVPYQHMGAISQYAVLAVEDIAKAVYPELF